MIVIYTGSNEIDKILEAQIKGSMVVSYLDFIIEDNKFKNQTAIIASNAIDKNYFNEYLYLLKSRNIRVILLLKSEREKETKIALQYGIYDLIFGNFYPSQIKDILEKPKAFEDISKIYKKLFNINITKKLRKDFRDGKD